jgi:hypothetical protein
MVSLAPAVLVIQALFAKPTSTNVPPTLAAMVLLVSMLSMASLALVLPVIQALFVKPTSTNAPPTLAATALLALIC